MNAREINSHQELLENIKVNEKAYLLLYKKGSDQSECSLSNLSAIQQEDIKVEMMMADVSTVRDIHTQYGINSVPTILEFEKGEFVNVLKGCHEPGFYKSFFENALYRSQSAENEKPQKRVTVYSTPTCSWCTTLKTHLMKNGIRYSEVDISKDQNAAEAMKRKSGQQGVPQTEINGQMIVGFDKGKIDRLLEIG